MINLTVVGILGIVIDVVLARLITVELWRTFREVIYKSLASTDPGWEVSAAAAIGDISLFGLLVLSPGLVIAGYIADRIGILSD